MKSNKGDQKMSSEPKGMIVNVYTNSLFSRCSNGGISEQYREVLVVGPGVPEIFEAKDRPVVKIVRRNIGGSPYVHAEPVVSVKPGNVGWMAGGAFIYTCDSRWREFTGVDYPISLHDRQDTYADYLALSV